MRVICVHQRRFDSVSPIVWVDLLSGVTYSTCALSYDTPLPMPLSSFSAFLGHNTQEQKMCKILAVFVTPAALTFLVTMWTHVHKQVDYFHFKNAFSVLYVMCALASPFCGGRVVFIYLDACWLCAFGLFIYLLIYTACSAKVPLLVAARGRFLPLWRSAPFRHNL